MFPRLADNLRNATKEQTMAAIIKKIGCKIVKIFKVKNRCGYAGLCEDHLTEGATSTQVLARMEKALARTERKKKK